MKPTPILLENQIQYYDWGSKNDNALIPKLLNIPPVSDKPYAELWMGAHPTAPSIVSIDNHRMTLKMVIEKNPVEMLGNTCIQKFGTTLPFLFKVLSAQRPLSIQMHPTKQQANHLHMKDPDHYPDENHKPEIAIALDDFTALIGFRPLSEIQMMLNQTPEIAQLIFKSDNDSTQKSIREHDLCFLFKTLLSSSQNEPAELQSNVAQLRQRLLRKGEKYSEYEQLFLDLDVQNLTQDIGLFALFFLKILHLKAFQGIFIPPGIPHAYVYGNIIECMANSDNVIRLGLTSKFKDIPATIDVLDCNGAAMILEASHDGPILKYSAPVSEFVISILKLNTNKSVFHDTDHRPVIIFCIEGEYRIIWKSDSATHSMDFKRGQAVFIPAFLKQFHFNASEKTMLFLTTPNL